MHLGAFLMTAARVGSVFVATGLLVVCTGQHQDSSAGCTRDLTPVDQQILRHAFRMRYNDGYQTDDKIAVCASSPGNKAAPELRPFLQRWRDLCVASYNLVIPGKDGFDSEVRKQFLEGSKEIAAFEATRSPVEPGLEYEVGARTFEVFCRNGFLRRVVTLADKAGSTSVPEIPPPFVAVFDCQDNHHGDPADFRRCVDDTNERYFIPLLRQQRENGRQNDARSSNPSSSLSK